VHPAASRLTHLKRVLILGGGDGLALRELGRYPNIQSIDLVDIDPAITRLSRRFAPLKRLNEGAFAKLPVQIHHEDAFNYVRRPPTGPAKRFDLVILDLPDPHHESLAKLYSIPFYSNLRQHLAPNGLIAAQLGSPFFANRTFWGSVKTFESSGFSVRPYHVNVPSFGEWGFVLAALDRIPKGPIRAIRGRFISPEVDPTLFVFSADLKSKQAVEATTLTRPRVVEYFSTDWRRWN
jgi:spermidine synthase